MIDIVGLIEDHKDFVTILLGTVGGAFALWRWRVDQKWRRDELARSNAEAEREGRLKRFEKYQQMQSRYRQDESIQAVFRWLYPEHYHDGDKTRPQVTTNDKLNFMGFYEELAIMVNSQIMTPEAAYYTFGVDAVEFWQKEASWHGDDSFKLFNLFVEGADKFQKKTLKTFDVANLYF